MYKVIEKNASSCKKGEYAMKFSSDKYLNQLIKSKENGLPKVITGIRRCGKSYFLLLQGQKLRFIFCYSSCRDCHQLNTPKVVLKLK